MLLLPCPFCGARNESEFVYGGALRARRDEIAPAASDADWIDYLTVAPNRKGFVREKWWHAQGCGKWLVVERDTVTHRVRPVDGSAS